MKIIILSITQYKEKDGIIDAVTEQGVTSFTVKGIFDPKSKFAALNNVMTIADVEFGDSRYKYPVVKSYTLIESPMRGHNDIFYLGSLMFLNEVTKKMMQDEEKVLMFKHLYAALLSLKGQKEPWMILLIYLANVFKVTGYDFAVTGCVFCQKKTDIRAFSLNDGGFVCGDCLTEDIERTFNKEQMLLIRSAFLANDYAHVSEYCTAENAIFVLNKFIEFIHENFGIEITSFSLLKK